MPSFGASTETATSLPIPAPQQATPDELDRRIVALEKDAGRLRADLLRVPLLAQEDLGVWTRFECFGQSAVALMKEVVRQASVLPQPCEPRIEAQIGRIEVAYDAVHVALQAIAALLPADGGGLGRGPYSA